MSNILNPKPRFGYNPDTGLIYDYVAQKDVQAVPNYAGIDGTWNLQEVQRAIMANETIEGARLTVIKPAAKPAPKPGVPVTPLAPGQVAAAPIPLAPGQVAAPAPAGVPRVPGQAQPTTVRPGQQPTTGAATHPTAGAMSVAELQALKLSPLQAAAMGISPSQMNVTGVTALQVANWQLTPARADALRLTKEQRLGLKIP
jgi:hypothetical protein